MSDKEEIEGSEDSQKRPRGRPPKSQDVVRADIVSDNINIDMWYVGHRNPDMTYKWGRLDNVEEMNIFASRGYTPATGDETIVGNPLESLASKPGERKIRGNRILMCCPKHLVEAREKARMSKYDRAAKEDKKVTSRNKLGRIETQESVEKRRESIPEPA
ncbi:MAG: hypothetical protein PHW65_00075 [Dehalococcoidales bacterium]|nr:hypothetical protein [Dehalococcoidales bacterium]